MNCNKTGMLILFSAILTLSIPFIALIGAGGVLCVDLKRHGTALVLTPPLGFLVPLGLLRLGCVSVVSSLLPQIDKANDQASKACAYNSAQEPLFHKGPLLDVE